MANNGWVKIHRKFLDWEWYTDTNTKAVFLHLIINANTEQTRWKGILLERGELIRTLPTLAEELNLSVQQVRTAINHLKSTGEITERSTGKIRVLNVCNYGIYQEVYGDYQHDNQQNVQQDINRVPTGYQQDINRISTTDKEYKNNKNKRNKESIGDSVEDLFLELWELYPRKMGKASVSKKAKKEIYGIGFDRMAAAIEKYKKQIATNGTEEKYIMYGSTFFNGKYADYLEKEKPISMEKQEEQPPEEEEERELTDEEWLATFLEDD